MDSHAFNTYPWSNQGRDQDRGDAGLSTPGTQPFQGWGDGREDPESAPQVADFTPGLLRLDLSDEQRQHVERFVSEQVSEQAVQPQSTPGAGARLIQWIHGMAGRLLCRP